jgi:hypothetical protein
LPSATLFRTKNNELAPKYHEGIPLGFYDEETDEYWIINHLDFHVKVHRVENI